MGNAEFAVSLLDEMERTGADRVEDIARHAATGNAVAAGEAAHSLKGAAAIIAAEPLRAVAAEIEAAGKSGRLEDIAVVVDQLRQEMERCLAFVPEIRKHAATRNP
jgi:HPt (histidine-containing phosphotransfer) domain-containing protein